VGCLRCLSFFRAMREAYLWDDYNVNSHVSLYISILTLNCRILGVFMAYFIMKPIGILIKKELERQERSVSWFARKLSCDRSNVYRLFQKENIDTGLLTRISLLLNHDFFADLSESIREK